MPRSDTTFRKASRGSAASAEARSTDVQFALLRLCRIVLAGLGEEPSAERVELRTLMGELQAQLGNHPTRASETSVAWDNDEEAELP